jgi:hypothetical protein
MGTITRSFANLITASGPSALPEGLVVTNTPAFNVLKSGTITVTDDTFVKTELNSKILDTDNAFDAITNYRFTVPSGKGGKYFFLAQTSAFSSGNVLRDVRVAIYKNGTVLQSSYFRVHTSDQDLRHGSAVVSTIDTASDGDYYEMYSYVDVGSGTPELSSDSVTPRSISFLGYRVGS